ncbi:MAG: hypothetical protein Q4C48_08910 [Lachnospiraceae bacterium]|nr:hypothetical protein [Lachnospiraceae bacterium]
MGKGKYEYWLTPEGLLKLEAWARDGATEENIAKAMQVSRSTLGEWKKKFPELAAAVRKGKDVADIHVENALYEKAVGIRQIVHKPIKLRRVEYDSVGKKVREHEEVVYADEEMYIPPDTTAQIFWLKNRKPETWRERQEPKKPDAGAENEGIQAFLAAVNPQKESLEECFRDEGEKDETAEKE